MERLTNHTSAYHPALTPNLPEHILQQAAACSDRAYAEGRYVLNDNVEEYINQRLGW